jgi:hypothetical protein
LWTDPDTGIEHSVYPSKEFNRDIQTWHAKMCGHERVELRRARYDGGAIHIRNQCLSCGTLVGNSISRANAPPDVKDWDSELAKQYKAERHSEYTAIYRRHVALQAEQDTNFKAHHGKYLKSPEWQKKRAKVLQRAKGICEGCGEAKATQVHHLTYEHWRDELMFELVAVCDACHDKCHPENDRDEEDDIEGDHLFE